jgi:hypothetical protein
MIQSLNRDVDINEEKKNIRLAVYQALLYFVDGKNKLNSLMKDIIGYGQELEKKSNYEFFLNQDLEKTRVMLKGYILHSRFITELDKKGIKNYTFRDIQKYLQQYIIATGDTIDDVALAVNLYTLVRDYKSKMDNIYDKVKNTLSEVFGEEMLTNSGDIRFKYQCIKERIERMNGRELFDERSNELLNALLNEIFSYYLNGDIIIPIDVTEVKGMNT